MPSKKTKEISQEVTPEVVALKGIAYVSAKADVKELDSKMKEYRKILEPYAEKNNTVQPSGSTLTVVQHADLDVMLKRTLRTSNILIPEALEMLKKNGFEKCVETVEVVREDVIELLFKSGEMTEEFVRSIYTSVPSFSFSVELKKHYNEE